MLINLTNNFHGTATVLRVSNPNRISARQIERARKALCGVTGCTCGGDFGERGPQLGVVGCYRRPDGTGQIQLGD